jgi:hypothetical protein
MGRWLISRYLGRLCRARCGFVSAESRQWEAIVLGEGEGLELLAVFITFMLGLGIMVVLGKWWEA